MNARPDLILQLSPYAALLAFVVVMSVLELVRKVRGVPRRRPRRWPMFTFVVLAAGIVFHLSMLGPPPNRPAAPARPARPGVSRPVTVLIVVGFPVAALLGVFGWSIGRRLIRFYDRDVARANKRSNQGDRAGAIAELRAVIAARGPSAKRLNGLGLLLIQSEEFDEARRVLEEAFALHPELSRNNLAIALLNVGDAAGAEAIYRPWIERKKPTPGPMKLGNYARFLIELDRLDEAESYLDRADALLAPESGYYYLGGLKPIFQEQIAQGRARIAERRGTKKVGIDLFPDL